MERVLSTEDKIRRAEEIYNRRKTNQIMTGTTKVNIREKKDIKLLKKMIVQIIICLTIYMLFYIVKNNNYIFSEDLINKTKEILSYDVNIQELYINAIEKIKTNSFTPEQEENENQNREEENVETEIQNEDNNKKELSQMEQDAISIKKSISFIKPIEGTISSKFGLRNPSTETVPKNHTGIDIASREGTKIHSATDGDVILTSSMGDYR